MTGSDYERLQAALGDAYTIERELGRGGMATVYLARDAKHQRRVALKVLDPNLAASLGPERFRREITTAAQLQHPHILGVHDSGETADGQLWFTMPYVEGESLRDRLRHERQMSVQDVVRIIREVAGALDYAHQKGVIHRDIKPENILLTTGGDALLADFGIARALDASATGEGTSRGGLTQTGLSIGTPQYMSPEQAAGERTLDARSDIFSLGAVCYEMLAGEPPFSGPTQQAIVAKILTTDAPSVRALRPDVSPAIDAVLARALQRVPAERWRSAGEMAHALEAEAHATHAPAATLTTAPTTASRRRIPASAFALLLGLAIGGGLLFAWRTKTREPAANASDGIRLAVLPFENMGDTSDAYFADGVTDAVRGKLTGLPGIEVIGLASSGQYRNTSKTPQQIGQELGVRYLLIGRVHWARAPGVASRVQVSPELVETGTAASKWQQPFDAPLTDVFQVQADIASKVAQALQVALSPEAKKSLETNPTKDLVAYDSYLRGMALMRSGNSPPILRRSIGAFKEAIARDSNLALAWSGLGTASTLLFFNDVRSFALADSADKATARALALQPDLAEARAARSLFYTNVRNDYARALDEAKTGLAHSQNATLLAAAASAEESIGDWDAAASYAAQAIKLDPRSSAAFARGVQIALWRRDTAAARKSVEQALSVVPANLSFLEQRIMIELQRGDLGAARRQLQAGSDQVGTPAMLSRVSTYYDLGWMLDSAQDRILFTMGADAFDGDTAQWAMVRAEQYAWRGDRENARKAATVAFEGYQNQIKANPRDDQSRMFLGLSLAILGRYDDAIRAGDQAVAMRSSATDAIYGPYNEHILARIYTLAGQPDRAIDILEKILQRPYYLTPAWLRIDPTFAPLKGNARFEKLVADKKPVA
ncbi:MAG: protein kinase domain-containing protein [Gemmatimonas sp.]